MIFDGRTIAPQENLHATVCAVGAGAAGISLALELAASGINVILLEAGDRKLLPENQDLAKGDCVGPYYHAPLNECRHRQLGGTTTVWGGRCLPLDSVDFQERDYIYGSGWPLSLESLEPYYHRAHAYCQIGRYAYRPSDALPGGQAELIKGLVEDDPISTIIERWGPPSNFGKEYYRLLECSGAIKVVLNANCIDIDFDEMGSSVRSVTAAKLDGSKFRVTADYFVLATGGLEVTRLLMVSNQVHTTKVGNHSNWLGRGYMGHLVGTIASATFTENPSNIACEFELAPEGVYCRRRLWISEVTQKSQKLLNIAWTLQNPSKHDPSHGNGVLSIAYLALRTPFLRDKIAPGYQLKLALGNRSVLTSKSADLKKMSTREHLKNVMCDYRSVFDFVPSFAYKRFLRRPRIPGFIVRDPNNVYDLVYHAEQTPFRESIVTLSKKRDRLGIPRLEVHYQVRESDLDSIFRAHQLIDKGLRVNRKGSLNYKSTDPLAHIRSQVGDGVHQLGSTRMAISANDGVVNQDCRVHGIRNLYIASSSVFPTSGQANPTLTIIALAIRIADHIIQTRRVSFPL